MRTKKQAKAHAAYMREWSSRNKDKVKSYTLKAYIEKHGHPPPFRKSMNRSNAKELLLVRRKIDSNGCWVWMGALSTFGHGLVRYKESPDIKGRGGMVRVHRLAAMLWLNHPLDDALHACHNCPGRDNPSCFNPQHLFIGTQSDNIKDAIKKGTFKQGFKIGNRRGISA